MLELNGGQAYNMRMQDTAFTALTEGRHWHHPNYYRRWLTPTMRYWLLSKGSLTAQLQHHFCHLALGEVCEHHGQATLAQAKSLAIAPRSALIIRNISLVDSQRPLIWAHSLMPFTSLTGANRQLRLQRDKPLGKILFAHQNLQRLPLQLSFQQGYWCRRSVFLLNSRPIMVAEAFAPELMT